MSGWAPTAYTFRIDMFLHFSGRCWDGGSKVGTSHCTCGTGSRLLPVMPPFPTDSFFTVPPLHSPKE